MNTILRGEHIGNSALASKYARPGPRYTSYPTAPHFSEAFCQQDFLRDWRARTHTDPLSLYVHIPFCNDICYYCACNKVVTRAPGAGRRYLDTLRTEIHRQGELHGQSRPVRQMHWGGGTPTYLDHAELTELMHELASNFKLLDKGHREYSIEIDPRTLQKGTIALLKGLGFNRISLGIQDFDPLVQKSINRIQPLPMVRRIVDQVRHHDFRSMSFDLIYGLPHQDRHTMESTLNQVIDLQPDRISCFNYAHLPERFSSQRVIDRLTLPSAAQKLALQNQIAQGLQAAGYRHIGLDHYVLPGDDLAMAQQQGRLQRNFQGYSVQMADDLVGLGASAISQLGDYYLQNARTVEDYTSLLERQQFAVCRGYRMNQEDRLRRHVIMQLICNLYLDTDECGREFDLDFWGHFSREADALRGMIADGLLGVDEAGLQIHEEGRPFLRNICMVFDQYLDTAPAAANAPRYSATL